MVQQIKIKRSSTTATPTSLQEGELAYSSASGSNKLFIGRPGSGSPGTVDVIGGKLYVDMLDHTAGVLTANSAIVVDSSSKIDALNVDNITIDANSITSTNTNGNITITPNGSGNIVLDGQTWPNAVGTDDYFLKTTSSGTLVWASIPSSSFTISDNQSPANTDAFNGGETLTFSGGTQIQTTVSNNNILIDYTGTTAAIYDNAGTPALQTGITAAEVNTLLGLGTADNPSWAGSTSGNIRVGVTGDNEIDTSSGNLTIDSAGGTVTIDDNLSVTGNLTINGTTTTVNSTTVTIDDPIFTLGGDTAPESDDNKDRGIEFRWHNGTSSKVGFFGFDDSTGFFTFIPDATNTSEVFSGTIGTIEANLTVPSTLTLDSVGVTAIQTSAEGFADNNTSLMTSAAIDDRILSYGYTTNTGTVTSVDITAGTLIDKSGGPITGSGSITIDVDLSEATEAVYAPGTDYLLFLDGGVTGTAAKESGADFAASLAGTGLAASEGVLSLDFSELTDKTTDIAGTTEFIIQDGTTESRKAASEIKLSFFNNDAGWTSNTGTVTSVTGGVGIASTGGTTPSLSLTVDELSEKTGALVGTDRLVGTSGTTNFAETISGIPLSIFNNDSGWTSNTGTVTSVGITAGALIDVTGSPITGSGSITVDVDLSELTDMTDAMVGTDELVVLDAGAQRRKAANEINLSIFNNDAGWTSNTGDITQVTISSTDGSISGVGVGTTGAIAFDLEVALVDGGTF